MITIGYEYDDGGRSEAGYKGQTGDCLPRALAIATGMGYKAAYKAVAEAYKTAGYTATGDAYAVRSKHPAAKGKGSRSKAKGQTNARTVQYRLIESLGGRKVKLSRGSRPTYSEAHAEYGNIIVSTTKHVCAIVGGKLRDTFDGREYEITDWAGHTERRERKAMSIWQF